MFRAQAISLLLAFVYVSVFLSASLQQRILEGPDGILPARLHDSLWNPLYQLIGYGNWQIDFVCFSGVFLSCFTLIIALRSKSTHLLLAGLFLALALLQLALINTSSTLIRGFGWEWQILETTFLVVALHVSDSRSSLLAHLLLRWLGFRVMLGAGLSKVGKYSSACWMDLSCTSTHYYTQPMPNPLSLFFHRLPFDFHRLEVLLNHFVELVLPWFLLIPIKGIAKVASAISIFYLVCIGATGNYAFIQTITIVPLLACFFPADQNVGKKTFSNVRLILCIVFFCWIAYQSQHPVKEMMGPAPWLKTHDNMYSVNSYGVFGFVNARRFGTLLSFSHDDQTFHPIRFWCLPGADVDRFPCTIAPLLHSRLDWSTWIATTASLENMSTRQQQARFVPPILQRFAGALLAGNREAVSLISNADAELFPRDKPPVKIKFTFVEFFAGGSSWWTYRRVSGVQEMEMSQPVGPSKKSRRFLDRSLMVYCLSAGLWLGFSHRL